MISGKSFSERCQWVVDPRYPTRPSFTYNRAKDGEWVFVNGDYLRELHRYLPLLKTKRFTFVIHNTDRTFGQVELIMLLPHANRIYAINSNVQHPKLTLIPLGFVDKQLSLLPEFKGGSSERTIEVYMNFLDRTNSTKRAECRAALAEDPRVYRAEGLSVPEYFRDLGRSKFVICPEGTGMDTHRVYESLLCGATPVVLHSPLDTLYEKLPVCIVSNWTDTYTVPTNRSFSDDVSGYL
jgi:hypothetical protein